MGQPTGYFQALETWRGLGALAISLWHLPQFGWQLWAGRERSPALYLSVDFFLILSGFILTHSYTYSPKVYTPWHIMGYRVARLWPLMAFMLVANLLIDHWTNKRTSPDWPFVLSQFFFVNEGSGPNLVTWTLTWEFWMSLPFSYMKPEMPGILLVLYSAVCYGIMVPSGNLANYACCIYDNRLLHAGMLRCSAGFTLGIATYKLYRQLPAVSPTLPNRVFFTLVELSLCVAIGVVVFAQVLRDVSWDKCYTDFTAPLIFAMVLICFAYEGGIVSLALRSASFLGTLSYSIYLDHLFVGKLLRMLDWIPPHTLINMLIIVVFWSTLLLMACCTYFLIEKPCMGFIRRSVDSQFGVPEVPATKAEMRRMHREHAQEQGPGQKVYTREVVPMLADTLVTPPLTPRRF